VTIQTIANPNEPRISVLAQALHRVLVDMPHGTVITYDELRKILFEDPRDSRGRAAIQRAAKLLLHDGKHLVNMRGKGYQIAYPNEHVSQSTRQVKLGLRRYRKALAIVAHTEMEKLTPQERQQVEEQTNRVRIHLALAVRVQRMKALPARSDVEIPTGRRLAELLLKKEQG
jgi:hypothetical protein